MKNKNRNITFSDFLRYRTGEMTNAERNSFEKELERDPFLSEAFEGLQTETNSDAEADLGKITRRLHRRAGRRFLIYRIAASVAVLMIISSVFIVIERNQPDSQQALPENKSVTLDIAMSEPLRQPEETNKTEIQEERSKSAKPAPGVAKSTSEPERKEVDEKISYDMAREKMEVQEENAEPEKKMAEEVEERKITDSNRLMAAGYSSNQPAAAVRSATRRDMPEPNASPRPSVGQEAYDRYISENIRRPDTAMAGQRVVVVASFRVKTDGSPDSIKINKSPRKEFSDEAIRLIKEGPAWKPAIRDGVAVEEEVEVRIVFP